MQAAVQDQLLTADRVAERLAVPKSHVWRLARRGEIPVIRIGRLVRFDPDDLQLWIDRRTSTKPKGTR